MAVQRHARLEPQGVAGGEARRHESGPAAGLEQAAPESGQQCRRRVELEAVLPRVARAGDEHRVPVVPRPQQPVVPEVGEQGAERRLRGAVVVRLEPLDLQQHLGGPGALQRDQPDVVRLVLGGDVEPGEPLTQRGDDLRAVRGVRDEQVAVLPGAVHDQVVHDPAARVEEQRVAGPPDRDRGDLAEQRRVERGGGLRADHDHLGHVREVEQARGRADRGVLGQVAGVADRHRPAGELRERGTGGFVDVVERRAAGRRVGHGAPSLAAAADGGRPVELPLCLGA